MASDIEVGIFLRLKDHASASAAKAMDAIRHSAGSAASSNKDIARSAAEVERAVQKEAQAYDRAGKALTAVTRATRTGGDTARRMAADSVRGANQMAAAWRKVENAARSAGKVMRTAGQGIGAAGQIGGGLMAGGYVLQRAAEKPIDFEFLLADMANTAFSGRDLAGRKAGMAELQDVINKSVRDGGGSRDSAAEALNAMIASGKVDVDSAMAMLPTIQKMSTATGAAPVELANIAIRGLQNHYFDASQIGEALDKAIMAGQSGGFELKDMARWLPGMMAAGKGLSGMSGFEAILASSQAAISTAGSSDEAGNNMVNLLAKMSSQDAIKNFQKFGVDLPKSLATSLESGVNPLDAFVGLIDKEVVSKNKGYAALQKRLATSGDDAEKSAILENMASILEGSAVGEIVQDRQALMALVALMNQREYIASVKESMAGAEGVGQSNFDLKSETTKFKADRLTAEKEMAQSRTLEAVQKPLNAAMDGLAEFGESFPTLTTAAYAAATAIAAMTAAAAGFGAVGLLRKGGGGLLTKLGRGAGAGAGAGGAVPQAAASGLSAVGKGAGMLTGVARRVPLLNVGLAVADAGMAMTSDASPEEKTDAVLGAAGGLAGGLAGAKLGAMAGAAIGSVVPVLGTAIGAALGGLIGGAGGYFLGEAAGSNAREVLTGDSGPITIENKLSIDGAIVAEKVNTINAREMTRYSR